MDPALTLRDARLRSGLTQADLAARSGTSQATVSAYERGHKEPSLSTISRLLAAMGSRLAVVPAPREPAAADLRRAGRQLADVLSLAEALPVRHAPELRYPRRRSLPAAA